jgi:hypothetical protein
MGVDSQWGTRQGEKVRLTVFRLNGKVGLTVQQGGNTPPVFLDTAAAYSIADQLMEQADEINVADPSTITLGADLEASLAKAGAHCLDIGF